MHFLCKTVLNNDVIMIGRKINVPEKIWTYINEQQTVLSSIMDLRIEEKVHSNLNVDSIKRIIFVGTGSSYNVAIAARPMFVTCTNKEILVTNPSDFVDSNIVVNEHTLVVSISQSGKSANTNNALNYVKSKGATTLAITFNVDSEIATYSDSVIPLKCGEEKVGAKTKGYTGTLLTLFLLAIHLGTIGKSISESEVESLRKDMTQLIAHYDSVIADSFAWLEKNPEWFEADSIYVVGGKESLGTVFEGTLKILEMYRKPILGYEMDEFIHGPYNAVGEGDFIIFLNFAESDGQIERLIEFMSDKTDYYCVIQNKPIDMDSRHRLTLPKGKELTANLLNVVPLQVFAYELGRKNGIDPGIPRYRNMHDFMGSKIGLVNFN